MRIAFITYEYPPDIAQGGIATYVQQAAKILFNRGNDVEIFCASHTRDISELIDGINVHRCKVNNPIQFQTACVKIFTIRHLLKAFDVMESPEINANAIKLKEKFPAIPLVVKLHMPLYVQMKLFNFYTSFFTKCRFFLGGLRRGQIQKYGYHNHLNDADYKITKMANAIVSPSKSLKQIIINDWKIADNQIDVIPYPFKPTPQLLAIPVQNIVTNKVTFIGKLNVHKGVVNLVKAIPFVIKKNPNVLFTLIGNDSEFSTKKMLMSKYIQQQLKGYEKNYIIKGGLIYEDVLKEYETATLCIFPSIWENFPLVCLEAMSAGRPIIGSTQGGMSELLDNEAGILIDPLNVNQMGESICKLLSNVSLRNKLGTVARKKVLANYNSEIIGKRLEEHFQNTIGGKN